MDRLPPAAHVLRDDLPGVMLRGASLTRCGTPTCLTVMAVVVFTGACSASVVTSPRQPLPSPPPHGGRKDLSEA